MGKVRVDRRELLRFMNSGNEGADGHHTAMTGFMGEPLAVGLILHFLRAQGKPAEFVSWKVTPGTRKGSRLDAWISDGMGALYQTEIKMWAGNAIGGLYIKEDAESSWLAEKGESQWHRWIWDREEGTFFDDNVRKVLGTMQRPERADLQIARIEPLLCLWWLVASEEKSEAWFTLPLREHMHPPFEQVHVFSLTRYLMGLPDDILELEMPRLAERLHWLERIFPG